MLFLAVPTRFRNSGSWTSTKKTHDLVEFELFNNELLLALPKALPKLDHLCLSNCFFSSCHSCVNSPLGHRPCAMTDISVDQLVEFATSLKTPLRSLSIGDAPWMSDVHVGALLSVAARASQGGLRDPWRLLLDNSRMGCSNTVTLRRPYRPSISQETK